MMRKTSCTLFLLALACSLTAQSVSQVEFGKNRVQYHREFDEWSQYESDNFITYWYGEARMVGQSVVVLAERDFANIQSILEHRVNEKIQIIVYKDLTDLKQSNIGSEEVFPNAAGQTKIVGNKVFVYFDGDHNDLRRQVREGIALVYLDAMLFGTNLQEVVQNAVMMNLPPWFKEGLVAYVGEPWNTDLDNELRDYILSPNFKSFERLAEENPRLAGHSFWHFIGENYGRSTVSNLLYLTRINRSIESGFLYVLGSPYEQIGGSWAIYFKQRYQNEANGRFAPDGKTLKIKNKRNLPITQLKLSPNGRQVAYVTNEIGKFKVFVQEVSSGKRELIFKSGSRNPLQATDYNYPLLAWNPNGQQLAIMYERRDVIKLLIHDFSAKKATVEDLAGEYQRIFSMDYTNPITLVLSAAVRGYSDIFLYYTNTRQSQRITNDVWDDLDASFVRLGGTSGILFASNRHDSLLRTERLDSILPAENFDLYFYDLDNRSRELVRVTDTPFANERSPIGVDTSWFAFLSDESGLHNRKMAYLEDYIHHYDQVISLTDGSEIRMHIDSSLAELDTALIDTIVIEPIIKKRAVSHHNSNYSRSVLSQSAARRNERAASLFLLDGRHQVVVHSLQPDTVITAPRTRFQRKQAEKLLESALRPPADPPPGPPTNILQEVEKVPAREQPLPPVKRDTGKVDIDNYLFQSEFDDRDVPPAVIVIEDKPAPAAEEPVRVISPRVPTTNRFAKLEQSRRLHDFRPAQIVPYRLQFRTDYVTTQMDNSLLFDGLNSFASNPDGFNYPPPGILLKGNLKDLFEDYEFEGGVRIPTTFNGSEYFLVFKDKKKRLDKHYAIYRRNQRFPGETQSFVPNRREANVVLGQASLRYPLDIFRSVRATGTLRRDRVTQLATDLPSLERPTITEQRIGARLEYVFDNTLDVALNLKNGTRYKFYGEAVKRFDLSLSDGVSLDFARGFMTIFGLDARHYQRVLKHSVFAARLAGATSFGSEKILYYLGGVDNWLFMSFNEQIPIPQSGGFAYQAVAANLRGFDLNIRNGNSYLLMNYELRAPIFRYFSSRIRSPFLRNFQVVGFFDVGTAWEGLDPFSRENPLNISVIDNGPLVSVKVNYFRDPIVAGYGVGVRALLFGYMLKLDYAWGIETRQVQDPKLFISLGMDF
jgi:hypothetical protein